MRTTNTLTVSASGDRDILMTRLLNAPRHLVFDAFTKPELIKRWLTGPPGWEMVTCQVDLRVGGEYRYVWRNAQGDMGMGGVYKEIVAPERIVCTEKFDQAWYEGEAVGTLVLTSRGGGTLVSQTIQYQSKQVRDNVLKSPMEGGVAYSYDKLEELLTASV
jgi:uncharacterized protein YndB with AHSA1/START domain